MEFISAHIQPDIAVLDPQMTQSMPPKVTAATGMDALCHAVEGYTCLQKSPPQRRLCRDSAPDDRRQSEKGCRRRC